MGRAMQGNPLEAAPSCTSGLAASPRGAGAGQTPAPLLPPRPPVLLLRTSASRTTAVGTPGDGGLVQPGANYPAHRAQRPAAAGRQAGRAARCLPLQAQPLSPAQAAGELTASTDLARAKTPLGSVPWGAGRKHCTWRQNQRDRGPNPRGSGKRSAPSSWAQRHRLQLQWASGALDQAQQGWPAAAGLCSEPAAPSRSLKNEPASPLLSHGSQWELGQGARSIAQLALAPGEPVQLREPMPFQLQDWGQLHQRVPLHSLSSHLCVRTPASPLRVARLQPDRSRGTESARPTVSPFSWLSWCKPLIPEGGIRGSAFPREAMPERVLLTRSCLWSLPADPLLHSGLCPQPGAYL